MTTVETYAKIAETIPRGLIGGAPIVRAEDEVKRKYRREPGFPVPILIAPATMWLIVFLFLLLTTMFIAACIALFLSLHAVVSHMFRYPETLGLIMAAQLLIGRYTGYRLSELFRFRDFVQPPPAPPGPRLLETS